MTKTIREQFEKWLTRSEDIDLEFKLASGGFNSSSGSLYDYCAAISNGRGGKLILGVQEKPRELKGTNCYSGTYQTLSHSIWQRLKIHVDVEEFFYNEKRFLIFHIPKHPPSARVKTGAKGDKYTYPIRRGESLGEMDDYKTREILNETQTDFTAGVVAGLALDDLDISAVANLKNKWAKESNRNEFLEFDNEKILKNLGLVVDAGITYAALILSERSLGV